MDACNGAVTGVVVLTPKKTKTQGLRNNFWLEAAGKYRRKVTAKKRDDNGILQIVKGPVGRNNPDDDDYHVACPICMEQLYNTEAERLAGYRPVEMLIPCGCLYHRDCLLEHLSVRGNAGQSCLYCSQPTETFEVLIPEAEKEGEGWSSMELIEMMRSGTAIQSFEAARTLQESILVLRDAVAPMNDAMNDAMEDELEDEPEDELEDGSTTPEMEGDEEGEGEEDEDEEDGMEDLFDDDVTEGEPEPEPEPEPVPESIRVLRSSLRTNVVMTPGMRCEQLLKLGCDNAVLMLLISREPFLYGRNATWQALSLLATLIRHTQVVNLENYKAIWWVTEKYLKIQPVLRSGSFEGIAAAGYEKYVMFSDHNESAVAVFKSLLSDSYETKLWQSPAAFNALVDLTMKGALPRIRLRGIESVLMLLAKIGFKAAHDNRANDIFTLLVDPDVQAWDVIDDSEDSGLFTHILLQIVQTILMTRRHWNAFADSGGLVRVMELATPLPEMEETTTSKRSKRHANSILDLCKVNIYTTWRIYDGTFTRYNSTPAYASFFNIQWFADQNHSWGAPSSTDAHPVTRTGTKTKPNMVQNYCELKYIMRLFLPSYNAIGESYTSLHARVSKPRLVDNEWVGYRIQHRTLLTHSVDAKVLKLIYSTINNAINDTDKNPLYNATVCAAAHLASNLMSQFSSAQAFFSTGDNVDAIIAALGSNSITTKLHAMTAVSQIAAHGLWHWTRHEHVQTIVNLLKYFSHLHIKATRLAHSALTMLCFPINDFGHFFEKTNVLKVIDEALLKSEVGKFLTYAIDLKNVPRHDYCLDAIYSLLRFSSLLEKPDLLLEVKILRPLLRIATKGSQMEKEVVGVCNITGGSSAWMIEHAITNGGGAGHCGKYTMPSERDLASAIISKLFFFNGRNKEEEEADPLTPVEAIYVDEGQHTEILRLWIQRVLYNVNISYIAGPALAIRFMYEYLIHNDSPQNRITWSIEFTHFALTQTLWILYLPDLETTSTSALAYEDQIQNIRLKRQAARAIHVMLENSPGAIDGILRSANGLIHMLKLLQSTHYDNFKFSRKGAVPIYAGLRDEAQLLKYDLLQLIYFLLVARKGSRPYPSLHTYNFAWALVKGMLHFMRVIVNDEREQIMVDNQEILLTYKPEFQVLACAILGHVAIWHKVVVEYLFAQFKTEPIFTPKMIRKDVFPTVNPMYALIDMAALSMEEHGDTHTYPSTFGFTQQTRMDVTLLLLRQIVKSPHFLKEDKRYDEFKLHVVVAKTFFPYNHDGHGITIAQVLYAMQILLALFDGTGVWSGSIVVANNGLAIMERLARMRRLEEDEPTAPTEPARPARPATPPRRAALDQGIREEYYSEDEDDAKEAYYAEEVVYYGAYNDVIDFTKEGEVKAIKNLGSFLIETITDEATRELPPKPMIGTGGNLRTVAFALVDVLIGYSYTNETHDVNGNASVTESYKIASHYLRNVGPMIEYIERSMTDIVKGDENTKKSPGYANALMLSRILLRVVENKKVRVELFQPHVDKLVNIYVRATSVVEETFHLDFLTKLLQTLGEGGAGKVMVAKANGFEVMNRYQEEQEKQDE